MARTYENFDITLEADGPIYHARVADDLTVTFGFPLEDHEIDPFLAMFGKPQTRKGTPQLERATAIGGRLFEALFTEELHEKWDEAEDAARRNDKGLRLRLDLSDAADLVTLPWEYLYEADNDSFLSLSNWTPIVRYLDVHEPVPPAKIVGALKILVMISDPIERRGLLDVEREWIQLNAALAEGIEAGDIELTRLPDGQLETLQFELQEHDYHVFHFIGHGEFSEDEDDGVLVLEDQRGREVHVSGRALGTHLRDSHSLRLAVLNNCEGGATSESDPFAGSAQSLLRKGIPAIVAMQFEITDRASIDFARGFYRSLGNGLPVDASLAEARKTLRDGPTHVEFGVPVLYMSSPDGNLFTKRQAVVSTQSALSAAFNPLRHWLARSKGPRRTRALVMAASILLVVVAGYVLFQVLTSNGADDVASDPIAPDTSLITTTVTTVVPVFTEDLEILVSSLRTWTPTEITLIEDDKFSVTATGQIRHNPSSPTDPNGDPALNLRKFGVFVDPDSDFVFTDPEGGARLAAGHGALIGRIGEEGNPFFIGVSFAGIAEADGVLYLGINDLGLSDNSGAFVAVVTVPAGRAEGS